eukprot:scaffold1769_cov277-Prasinococcus_capsulatus_cf.AAC.2
MTAAARARAASSSLGWRPSRRRHAPRTPARRWLCGAFSLRSSCWLARWVSEAPSRPSRAAAPARLRCCRPRDAGAARD